MFMAPEQLHLTMDPLTIHQRKQEVCSNAGTYKAEPKKYVDYSEKSYERQLWKERRRAQGDRI